MLIVIIYINIYWLYNIYKLLQIKKFQRSFVIFFLVSLSLWLVTYRWSIRSMAHQTNGLSVYYILSRFLRPTSLKVNQMMNQCSAEIVCEYISRWEGTRIRMQMQDIPTNPVSRVVLEQNLYCTARCPSPLLPCSASRVN